MITTKFVELPKEVFHLMSPIWYLSRLFCFMPLAWRKINYQYVVTKSTLYIFYSYVTLILMCKSTTASTDIFLCDVAFSISVFICMLGLKFVFETDEGQKSLLRSKTGRFTLISGHSFIIIPGVVGVINACLKMDKYIKFIDNLNQVDLILQKCPKASYSYWLVIIRSLFLAVVILSFNLTHHSLHIVKLGYLPFALFYFLVTTMELFYRQSVYVVKLRIVILNERIKENFKLSFLGLFNKINKQKITSLAVPDVELEDLEIAIQNFICAYQKLTEAINLINDYYGLNLLMLLIALFFQLLVTPYFMYIDILKNGLGVGLVFTVSWLVVHISRFLLIIEPNHQCLTELETTSDTVRKLISCKLDNKTKKLLKEFYTYLSAYKVEFTALDLFEIHRGLITSVFGTVTIYLVILIQFYKVE